MKTKSMAIARFAIIAAVIIVGYSIDAAISMAGLPIRLAVVTLILMLTMTQQFGLGTAVFATTVFGLTSFIFAYAMPNPTSEAFRNPLISIAPRVVIGFTSYFAYVGVRKLTLTCNKFMHEIFPRAIGGAVGVLTNTVLVISMMAVFKGEANNAIYNVIDVIMKLNFIIEISSGLLIVPTLSQAVSRPIKRLNI